jgi:2-haloalkanoic acid dehalogenase type II
VNQSSLPRALLLDFYGTIVKEDTVPIRKICERIAEASSSAVKPAEVGSYWGRVFSQMCFQSYGKAFQLQKELERLSLKHVLQHFESDLDGEALSETLYEYWSHPTLFPESTQVLAQCKIPICLVSNIDNAELKSALKHNGLYFDQVVTSEDCRAYKPRGEMFHEALSLLGLSAGEVLHVGDSLGSDVRGARSQGIPVLWVNRRNRQAPCGEEAPDYVSADLWGLMKVLRGAA